MSKKRHIIKWAKRIGLGIIGLILLLFGFGYWFISLIPKSDKLHPISQTQVANLPYLTQNRITTKGKILAVVTSVDKMGSSDKSTGYELTELARAYYVFEANGYEVDIASPKGGEPPVVLDDDDMWKYDYAFINDPIAQNKVKNSIPIAKVEDTAYEAIYFVGGKGAMFDLPDNTHLQQLIKTLYQNNKVIGGVCHGPAALAHVTLDSGTPLVANKKISSFTNAEELLLIPDAENIFPFLLEDELNKQGARFQQVPRYLEQVSRDGNLVTGQNPWSTWATAEGIIQALGQQPKPRKVTPEEHAVAILGVYYKKGLPQAKEKVDQLISEGHAVLGRQLIAQHSILGVMTKSPKQFLDLVRLTAYTKNALEEKS